MPVELKHVLLVLVRVTICELVWPMTTDPKLRVFGTSFTVPGVTAIVAPANRWAAACRDGW